ncbi:MAG: MFS transporter [Erysipelotrichaceae bacterium]|nr:MFS transporter [Erysipelotrichaceae bacterium]
MKKKNSLFLIITLCLMAASSIGLFLNTFGIFFTPIADSLNEKRGTVAIISTILIFSSAIFSIILPRVANDRNYKKIYIAGIIGTFCSLVFMANAASLLMLYAGALLLGVSFSVYHMVMITTIINSSFDENIGTINGVVFSFAGIAGAVFAPLFSSVIEQRGWRAGFYVMAIAAAVMCRPGIFAEIKLDRKAGREQAEEKAEFNYMTLTYLMSLLMSFSFMFLPSLPQHFPGLALCKGLRDNVGPLMVSSAMIGNIAFKLLAGVLADKLGTIKTIIVIVIINITGSLMLFSGSTVLLLAGAGLYGSIYAVSSVLIALYAKELYGLANYKKAYPIIVFAGNVANAVGISAVGYIYDFTSSYDLAVILVIVLAAAGTALAVISRKKGKNS